MNICLHNHIFSNYFEDWLTTIEVRPGVYQKSEKKCLYHHKSIIKGIKITVRTVIELAHKIFDYA